jgi:hypothetical protein
VFDKIQTVPPGAIVDNKQLSAVLEQIKAQRPPIRRISSEGTWRGNDRRTIFPAVRAGPRGRHDCGNLAFPPLSRQ